MKPPSITITAWGEKRRLVLGPLGRYQNGRLGLAFLEDDEPYGMLTVNLPDAHLNEGELFIKDWSENEPLVAALIEAGWLVPTGREVQSGFVFPRVMTPAGALADYIEGASA